MNGSYWCSRTSALSFLKSRLKAFLNWWSICSASINFAIADPAPALSQGSAALNHSKLRSKKWANFDICGVGGEYAVYNHSSPLLDFLGQRVLVCVTCWQGPHNKSHRHHEAKLPAGWNPGIAEKTRIKNAFFAFTAVFFKISKSFLLGWIVVRCNLLIFIFAKIFCFFCEG